MLDKAIEHGKEWRKPYYHSERFDLTCRPHGSCPWCYGRRMHNSRVRMLRCEEQEEELKWAQTLFEITD